MEPKTVGMVYNVGKVARIRCVKNDKFDDLDIRDKAYALFILYTGEVKLALGDRILAAQGPCLVCLDESENPRLVRKRGVRCDSVYFHPTFFNVNLTFERIHNPSFREVALAHDLYLMQPFTCRKNYVFPLFGDALGSAERLFGALAKELATQTDCYWSCRSRTYFIQLIFLLERVFGYMGDRGDPTAAEGIRHPSLRAAVLFMEGHYGDNLRLSDIAEHTALSSSTLTRLFKEELGMTPIEYLWHHRIAVAKQQLRFTLLPMKEIAMQCGFKTLPHFSRRFEESTGQTPTDFRSQAVEKRMAELNCFETNDESGKDMGGA